MNTPKVLTIRPKISVEFDYALGNRVVVRGSSIEADVISLIKGWNGEMYEICWWYNGTRYNTYVFSREIALKT